MSDPSWGARTLPQSDEGLISIQAAGTVAAPVAADELAFCTEFSLEIKGSRKKKGPWINYSKQKNVAAGVAVSGKANIDWSKAVDAVRALVINAAINQTRVKLTFTSYTSGDSFVCDQVAVDASVALKAEDGQTGEFSFDADGVVYTAATA